ncbi:MAG: hypothetical protein RR956_08395, partial [Christensenella sp.]
MLSTKQTSCDVEVALRIKHNAPAWEQRKLGDVASSLEYGLNASAGEYDGTNKYLRITDIDDETR